MFALIYEGASKTVHAVNGSGSCPQGLTLDHLIDCLKEAQKDSSEEISIDELFMASVHSITVPGAARGWEDLYQKHGSGKFTFAALLEPAAKLAEDGFPVAPVTAKYWDNAFHQLCRWVDEGEEKNIELSSNGKPPKAGEIFQNPGMARVLRELGINGSRKGFYEGYAGKRIVEAVQKHGGRMSTGDLSAQKSTFPEPINVEYRGVRLWQVPPNGQGIAGLIALQGLSALESNGQISKVFDEHSFRGSESLHSMIEMMRLGFSDAQKYVADERYMSVTNDWLLDDERIKNRASKLYHPDKAVIHGTPLPSSGTVSFQVVDKDQNAISFVNSNYMGFGNGVIPSGCGFSLQNRGYGFSLDPKHPNGLAPGKRPYHTIIPGMLTHADESNDLYATLSNMGGFMQPQGHMQLTVALVGCGMDPQKAVDHPRFCIADGTQKGTVFIEDGFDDEVLQQLKYKGHNMRGNVSGFSRSVFGKAQIIKVDRESGVLWAGSDGRSDGCAMGY